MTPPSKVTGGMPFEPPAVPGDEVREGLVVPVAHEDELVVLLAGVVHRERARAVEAPSQVDRASSWMTISPSAFGSATDSSATRDDLHRHDHLLVDVGDAVSASSKQTIRYCPGSRSPTIVSCLARLHAVDAGLPAQSSARPALVVERSR